MPAWQMGKELINMIEEHVNFRSDGLKRWNNRDATHPINAFTFYLPWLLSTRKILYTL